MRLFTLLSWTSAVAIQSILARSPEAVEPAPVSCNAQFSAPCARTNSEWLAVETAAHLKDAASRSEQDLDQGLASINKQVWNRDTGFYPFVIHRDTGVCVAHGGNANFVGKTISQIFDMVQITYSDANAAHARFREADHAWVQYLWSDGGRVNSKLAFIVNNITSTYYLGVGYENEPLPQDTPCSDDYDSWCSLTNVRSLVGQAQFKLNQAHSLETFESTIFRVSFDEEYKIPAGFYLFMYHFDGELKAHGVLRDSFGMSLSELLPDKRIGTAQDGRALHAKFVKAVSEFDSAWVQYRWRNSLDEEPYIKVAFLIKVSFDTNDYYLGAGFNLDVPDYPDAPFGEPCSDEYNLPCSFRTAYQLSSHTLSHVIASPLPLSQRFRAVSEENIFKNGDFYVFIYNFDSTCVAHGGNERFVGMTLSQVFIDVGIDLDADRLHEQFRHAAKQGGGWVLYDWVTPGETFAFEKISYMFQISIDGEDYYGGVGFRHQRASVEVYSERGLKKNGDPILCSQRYGLECSEANARSILGQALAELTLSSSEASSARVEGRANIPIESVFEAITSKEDLCTVNDFAVSVFSFEDNPVCKGSDGSGCAVAHGPEPSYQGLTWNEILEVEGVSTITGVNLHEQLVDQSHSAGSVVRYSFGGTAKLAWTARFRHEGQWYYAVAEYFATPLPPTCDDCPAGTGCLGGDQKFCEPIPAPPITDDPIFITFVALFAVGIPATAYLFWRQKRRAKAKRRAIEEEVNNMARRLEQQMQGMFEVLEDMPIRSPDEYKRKHGVNAEDKASRRQIGSWYWEEDDSKVAEHFDGMVLKGTSFVSYSLEISRQIEHAYQRYIKAYGFKDLRVDLTNKITSTKTGEKLTHHHTGNFYEINFESMVQTNSMSKFTRHVRREEIQSPVDNLPLLPSDITFTGEEKEGLLPTFNGQIIQVSRIHPGNEWMYGNVLYDPLMDEAILSSGAKSDDDLNAVLSSALHDRPTSGWFPRSVAKEADVQQMHKLLKNLGGDGSNSLDIPGNWDESGKVRVELKRGTPEYDKIAEYFLAALYSQRKQFKVLSVHRIQNVPLWQSYSVKKQTMKTRYERDPSHIINNRRGLHGLERRWLFHGTKAEVIPKIEVQGFNRSYAGDNVGAVYGRGVYVARDASYSSHPSYSVPDADGIQHMFLCSVAVGDWCMGRSEQITPDPKPYNAFELHDSTVDNVSNPSVFVIYHDSQAYPEYLVSFKQRR